MPWRIAAPLWSNGTHPKTGALSYRSLVLWGRGAMDQITTVAHQAVEQARALGHRLCVEDRPTDFCA